MSIDPLTAALFGVACYAAGALHMRRLLTAPPTPVQEPPVMPIADEARWRAIVNEIAQRQGQR